MVKYFVLVHRRDGLMENAKIGGYVDKKKAYKRFRKYATSCIKVYTSQGLKLLAARVNGKEKVCLGV